MHGDPAPPPDDWCHRFPVGYIPLKEAQAYKDFGFNHHPIGWGLPADQVKYRVLSRNPPGRNPSECRATTYDPDRES